MSLLVGSTSKKIEIIKGVSRILPRKATVTIWYALWPMAETNSLILPASDSLLS